ncbi:MAG: histidinol dehydrogenase [Planctomycetia bacterium]|nr:histidinol dehydrogenase [Planctomycetia bacterium]
MTAAPKLCERIDLAAADGRLRLDALRKKLVSQGDVVSPASRQRTIDVFGAPLSPRQVVERICEDVRAQGLPALLDYSRRIDRADVSAETLVVRPEALAAAHAAAPPAFLAAVRRIRDRVTRFQEAVLARDVTVPLGGGGSLRQRYMPLGRIGVCVPGGAAAYPSTLLMTVVPAKVAGVPEIVVVAPPTPFGADNPHVLATCQELGVTTVVRAGGAQAVAGPSEIVIVADEAARPEFIAADMLAQAEHSPGSAILLTASGSLADQVAAALARQLEVLERAELTRDSLERFAGIVVTRSDEESADLAHELAPEHLSIDTRDPEASLARIRHVGAAFLGPWSPVAAGDYAAGPSHVLPTGGTARFAAGLSANDFLRAGSVITLSQADLAGMADDIRLLADTEGLTAHRRSVTTRLSPA